MAEESEDDSSKTEDPTPRRLEEARKKGQIAQSREVNHFFMMLSLTFILLVLLPAIGSQTVRMFSPFILQPDTVNISGSAVTDLMNQTMINFLMLLGLPFVFAMIAAFAPAIIQNKFVFSTEHIKPKLEKLSPLKGFGRIFGKKALIEFLKHLLKVIIVGSIGWLVMKPYQDTFKTLMDMSLVGTLETAQWMGVHVMIYVVIFLFALALGDYLLQRFMHLKQLRMSKKELKDEYKQQEGDPHIKAKQKQIRRDRARKRMMQDVPTADVVITNPTHYAVALKYEHGTMQAPKLVAKGADLIAAKIREIAEKNKVPIVRNPPLARVLYDTLEVDDEIPYEHYGAVAKVIGYVYKLKGKTGMGPTASAKDNPRQNGLSQKGTPAAKKPPKPR